MSYKTVICESLMRLFPASPNPYDPHLWEVFKTEHYRNGSNEHQRVVRHSSSLAAYQNEQTDADSWLVKYFFPRINTDLLRGKVLLDLGSFTGGRLIAWAERYNLKMGLGLDINPIFELAAGEFAKFRGISNVEFSTGFGENIPYDSNSIDFIISTDVFEHVRDVKLVLDECHRILKPSGKLCVVFPQYLQPLEAHLGMVTKTPALHWFFTEKIISDAYFNIISKRSDANWYKPESYPLRDWEKLFALNGTSIRKFESQLLSQKWTGKDRSVRPILTDGRKAKKPVFRLLSSVFLPLAYMPYINELFLGRINYILTK